MYQEGFGQDIGTCGPAGAWGSAGTPQQSPLALTPLRSPHLAFSSQSEPPPPVPPRAPPAGGFYVLSQRPDSPFVGSVVYPLG